MKPGPLLKAALAALVRQLRHLLERFEPDLQGRTKIFRDGAITSLQLLVEGTQLVTTDRPALSQVLANLADAVKDVRPVELRQSPVLRELVAADLRHALNHLEPLLARRKEKVPA